MIQQARYKIVIKKLLGSRVFLFCLSIVLIFLAISVGRESYRKAQLTKEIDELRLEIERLEGTKHQLSDLLESFGNESYLEKEARLKLNLKKSGEEVVVFPPAGEENSSIPSEEGADSEVEELSSPQEDSIWWKWWEYFFEE